MKKCSNCGETKLLEEFPVNNSKNDGRGYYCRECQKLYVNEHYKNNKNYYKTKSNKRRLETQQWYKDYKSKLHCEKCGENHPACLDFHHKDRKTKEVNLPQAVNQGWSINRILKEISKCSVLCCKCHRILHYEEDMAFECDG